MPCIDPCPVNLMETFNYSELRGLKFIAVDDNCYLDYSLRHSCQLWVKHCTVFNLYTFENLLQKRVHYYHIFRQRLFNSGSSHDLKIAAYLEFFYEHHDKQQIPIYI